MLRDASKPFKVYRFLTLAALSGLLLPSCSPAPPPSAAAGGSETAVADEVATIPMGPSVDRPSWDDEDWRRFRAALEVGWSEGLDTLPMGEAVARMGLHFVGTPYEPQTLEVPGPERVVVNLRALDCVTFVESVLALTTLVRTHDATLLTNRAQAELTFEQQLAGLRYRDGEPQGYASRLHYFSEWLSRNTERGHLRLVTRELGGVEDPEPIYFMSSHPDAYRQLADAESLAAIRDVERSLNTTAARHWIPEGAIAEVSNGIETGDVIAATSTVPGLDVAHTGLAIRIEGRLHLLHAPLVGDSVEVSQAPLAERIQRIAGQDGIMVARPLDPS